MVPDRFPDDVDFQREIIVSDPVSHTPHGTPRHVEVFRHCAGIVVHDIRCEFADKKQTHANEASGKPIRVQDAMIAATARAHGALLVTRNVIDFADCDIDLINPWSDIVESPYP